MFSDLWALEGSHAQGLTESLDNVIIDGNQATVLIHCGVDLM